VRPCGEIVPGPDPLVFTRERWYALTAQFPELTPVAPTLQIHPATGKVVHHDSDPAPMQLWIDGQMAGFLHWDKSGRLAILVWSNDSAAVNPFIDALAARFGARYTRDLT
jgi:hypothetical protein